MLKILFLFAYFASHVSSESCSDDLVDEIAQWSNNLDVLIAQDKKRRRNLDELPSPSDVKAVRNVYYKTVSETQQTACNIIKRFGGRWLRECGFLDGEKIVCMDNLYKDIEAGNCLVYSFGIGDNWDFETKMAKMGCTVHAYDPNVEIPTKDSINFHFHKTGLGGKVGVMKNGAPDGTVRQIPVLTLDEALRQNGDEGKEITYLKMDVEGAEFVALPQMIESKVFTNVRQMGIEMHTGSRNLPTQKIIAKTLHSMLTVFKELQENYGFRLIAYNANGCMGTKYCLTKSYHNFHDIVFYKP